MVEATPQQPPPAAVSDGRPGSSSDQPQEAPEIPQFFEGSAFGVVQQRPMPKVKCHFTSAIKRHSQSSGSVLVVLFNAHRNDDATRVRNFLATVSTKQDHVFCTWEPCLKILRDRPPDRSDVKPGGVALQSWTPILPDDDEVLLEWAELACEELPTDMQVTPNDKIAARLAPTAPNSEDVVEVAPSDSEAPANGSACQSSHFYMEQRDNEGPFARNGR